VFADVCTAAAPSFFGVRRWYHRAHQNSSHEERAEWAYPRSYIAAKLTAALAPYQSATRAATVVKPIEAMA